MGFAVAQMVKNQTAMQETQESWVRILGGEDILEKRIASNPLQYSCLENATSKKPGGLQCMGSKRVRHD